MRQRIIVGVLTFCCAVGVHAQQSGTDASKATSGTVIEPSKSFDAALTAFEGQFMGLAKAMPADKYSFAPSAAIFAASQKTDYLSEQSGSPHLRSDGSPCRPGKLLLRWHVERNEARYRCESHRSAEEQR